MGMKKYLYTFCYSTSIKGVSRILKAEVIGLRILWFLAVFCFFGMAAYQVILLVSQYFDRPTLTNIKEGVISMSDVDQSMPPPQITVCNLNPFTSYPIRAPGLVPFSVYKQLTCLYSNCQSYLQFAPDGITPIGLNVTASMADKYIPTAASLASYYQFIGRDAASGLSHTKETFLIGCKILKLYGLRFVKEDCGSAVEIVTMPTVEYLNCFEIYIDSLVQGKAIRGLELTMYLDNVGLTTSGMEDSALDRTSGAKIFIHEPHTKPFININGIYLMPGEWSRIQVKQEKRTRLAPPWGECYNEVNGTLYNYTFNKRQYTLHGCLSVCIEHHMVEDCNCKDVNLMSLLLEDETEEMKKLGYCQDIKLQALNHTAYYDQYICAEISRGVRMDNCSQWCQLPCEEMRYRTTTSHSRWPKTEALGVFYNQYINGRVYQNRFPTREEWDASPRLAESLINENFLRASIYMGDYRYNMYVDKRAMTPSTLLSQLGGALNLWSGITVIIIIEVVDLIIHIIQDKCYPDKTQVIKVKQCENQI